MRTLESVLQLIVIYTVCVMDAPVRTENKCDAKYLKFEQQNKTEAEVGTNITIPCVPKFSIDWDNDIITWEKDTKVIFGVRVKKPLWENKTLKDRIDINITKMEEERHASFTVSNVTKSYEGDYCCCIQLWKCEEKWMCINHTVVIKDKETPNDYKLVINGNNTDNNSLNATNVPRKRDGLLAVPGIIIFFVILYCYRKGNRQESQPQENHNDDHPRESSENQQLMEESTNHNSNDASIEMRPQRSREQHLQIREGIRHRTSSENQQLMEESTNHNSNDGSIEMHPRKSQEQHLQIREGIRHRTSSENQQLREKSTDRDTKDIRGESESRNSKTL